jgi:RNA polymerase sigma factor (sigma-70 family)
VGVTVDTTIRTSAVTDREALYAGLFAAHFRRLVQLAVLLGDDDPENVVQEAFARLHTRRDRLRDDAAALTYVRRSVINLCNSKLRHLRVARRAPIDRRRDFESAEQTAIAHERSRELVAALQQLPRRQRDALVLRYWLELPLVDIAETLDMAVGTVKSTIARGRQALARILEDPHE